MAKCTYCDSEIDVMWDNAVPICLKCDQERTETRKAQAKERAKEQAKERSADH
jgi:hypothetical protein